MSIKTRKIGLIIFDCDGVLVDSERITNEVFCEMLNELGASVDIHYMFDHFVGNSMSQCLEKIEALLGRPPSDNFVNEYKERTQIALSEKLQPVPGIKSVLERLSIPFCIASSGDHEKIKYTLSHTGLYEKFIGHIFSVTDIERSKPYPDVYLFAAKQMGYAPEECLVVEDTPLGVQAGVAAGMTVFGFSKDMAENKLLEAGAHHTFHTMNDFISEMCDFFEEKVS